MFKKALNKEETRWTKKLICPYCHEEEYNGEFHFESGEEKVIVDCESCSKTFEGHYDHCSCGTSPFSSNRIDCSERGNGRNHRWKLRNRTTEKYKYMKIEEDGVYPVHCYSKGSIPTFLKKGKREFITLDPEHYFERDQYGCKSCDAYKWTDLDKDGNPVKKVRDIDEIEKDIPKDKSGEIEISDTKLIVTTNTKTGDYRLWKGVMSMLSRKGFKVSVDPFHSQGSYSYNFSKKYKVGEKGDLKFCSSVEYNSGFSIEFWQDIVLEDGRDDGRYGSRKREKMPYLIEKEFEVAVNHVKRFLNKKYTFSDEKRGYKIEGDDPEKYIIQEYNSKGRFESRKNINSLSEIDGTIDDGIYVKDRSDKYKKEILQGDFKYARDYKGYLYRGKVYHTYSSTWYMITNIGIEIFNACDLFDYKKGMPLRYHPHNEPESKIRKLNSVLSGLSSKQKYEQCIPVRDLILKIRKNEQIRKNN